MGQEEWSEVGGQWSEKIGKKAIFKISGRRMIYDDNSFRNGEFHVPLKGETRPERGRNGGGIGTPKKGVRRQKPEVRNQKLEC